MERRDNWSRRARLEREKAAVSERLRRVCQDMTDEEFAALVERVAELNVRYTYRLTADLFSAREQE